MLPVPVILGILKVVGLAVVTAGVTIIVAINRTRETSKNAAGAHGDPGFARNQPVVTIVNAAGAHGDPGFARNQPMETTVNAAGAHGDPGKKQKTCPPRYRKPPVDQKED